MALDDTIAGANANTYADEDYATEYNSEGRANSEAWDDVENQEGALRQAARLLDAAFKWTGAAATTTQKLAWPRTGMTSRNGVTVDDEVIPDEIKDAQCEWARRLGLASLDDDNDAIKQGITSIRAGSVSLGFSELKRIGSYEELDAAIQRMGPEFDYLAQVVPDAVRMLIPESWYERSTIGGGLFFEAM